MAKKQENVPRYGTAMRRGIQYYRTRITDADGKRVDLYAETCEELQLKEMEARRQVEEAVFRRKHPTVAEYCEKWLLMQSAKVSSGTLRGYTQTMNNYIVKPLGDMYLEDVTADDIRLAMIPLASKSAGLYSKVNMLLKCVFYTIQHKDADGRISRDNKAWAKTIPMPEDKESFRRNAYLVVDQVNPGLVDLFIRQARKTVQEKEKGSVLQKLKQELPAHKPAASKKREPER